jgi:hypothetical protein
MLRARSTGSRVLTVRATPGSIERHACVGKFRPSAEEVGSGADNQVCRLRMLRRILAEHPSYREYMLRMSLLGAGNLVLIARLVVIFAGQLHLSSGVQIGLLSVVPLVALPTLDALMGAPVRRLTRCCVSRTTGGRTLDVAR